jgi:hypothetical protein
MSVISLVLNLLWIIFGGLWMALGWVIEIAADAPCIRSNIPLWPAYYRQRGPVFAGLDHQYFQSDFRYAQVGT